MTTEHQVIQHLRDLNPVVEETTLDLPDTSPTAFLAALERAQTERMPMSVETTTRDMTRATGPHRRRNLVLALGTAAVIVVAVVVGIAIAGSDSGEEVAATPPIQVAEQIMEAHIAGGPIAMLEFFESGYADIERPSQEVFQILNERIIDGEFRCEETRPGRVLRRTPTTNDFHSAGGIDPDVTWTFTFNEASEVVGLQGVAGQVGQIRDYNDAFTAWLLETYPDVAGPGYVPTADPASAEIAVRYVNEFVAQSDDYPIGP